MAKRSGSYESIIKGVSQQVPHDRLPGQHWEQVNMISDPVRGLARRPGSVMVFEKLAPSVQIDAPTLDDLSNFKAVDVFLDGSNYSILYRPQARPFGSSMPGILPVRKETGAVLDVQVNPADMIAVDAITGGLSCIAPVGKYLAIGVLNRNTTYTQVDKLAATATQSVAWVKGGGYSRTFSLTVFPASGSPTTVSYKTKNSYYEGVLDTSDILTSDPDYQKKVNDRTHAYNTAVNQYIATAAADITPENIAEKLRLALVAAAVPGLTVVRSGSHLYITGPVSVTVDDGGNGDFIKAVAQEIESTDDLTLLHVVGKVVRVTPKQQGAAVTPSYYLRAKAPVAGLTGLQEVIWEETAGNEITITFAFLLGAVVGDVLYVASSATLLEGLSGLVDVPRFEPSVAGDLNSQPVPHFLGKPISYMRPFQDRLLVIADAVVYASRPGDYFNFFRASALTLAADDPWEVFAEGSEGDVVTDSVAIDRNLLLFGRRQQYAIPGREPMTPHNAFVAVQSAHEDAQLAPPVASGSLVFFPQVRGTRLTIQQLQTGAYADAFDAFDTSPQLDGYLAGTPRQLVALTGPSMLFIRVKELDNQVFVYSYLDSLSEQSRLFDSWGRWEWSQDLGHLVGIFGFESAMYSVTLREGDAGVCFVVDRFSREPQLTDLPYLDSMRQWQTVGSITPTWVHAAAAGIALPKAAGEQRLLGEALPDYADLFISAPGTEPLALAGTLFESYCEPTAPYIRDRNGRAVLDSLLTLTQYTVALADTSAIRAAIRPATSPVEDEELVLDWIERPAGFWALNSQQIAMQAAVTVPVMQEIRDFRLRLYSRNWLPMTLTGIEWSGQYFTARRGS